MDRRAAARRRTSGGGGGGREDCWSEEATEALIEAWGGRYVGLNRGHLRQSDWDMVSAAVNARRAGDAPPKTDAQCKNRIDTLKKKYKVEKSKPIASSWSFFLRLDSLIGAAKNPSSAVRSSSDGDGSDGGEELGFGAGVGSSGGGACGGLAGAILRFGEVYERTERLKQKQAMEIERRRMEFAKDLELQRMNMFVDTQLELQKMKRPKHTTDSGKKV